MGSSYTTRNRLEKQGDGENENTWGQILNTVIDLVDESTDGYLELDVSAADITLTTNNGSSDQARNRVLKIIGSPVSNRTITLPDIEKNYIIEVALSGSNTVNILNVADSTGVTVSSGSNNLIIHCDGTSTRSLIQDTISVFSTTDITGQTSAAVSTTSEFVHDIGGALFKDTLASMTTKIQESVQTSLFPVGSIYTNYNVSTNPATLLGFGTWTAVSEGRVLVGAGEGTDINAVTSTFTATSTGGEYVHTMTSAEMFPHRHELLGNSILTDPGSVNNTLGGSGTSATNRFTTSVGTGDAFNVQQPYLVVYMWRRTA